MKIWDSKRKQNLQQSITSLCVHVCVPMADLFTLASILQTVYLCKYEGEQKLLCDYLNEYTHKLSVFVEM